MKETIVLLPNLNEAQSNLDSLYWRLSKLIQGEKAAYDLSEIVFLRPMGVISLFLAVKQAYELTREPVRLFNIKGDVYSYLDRVNFFDSQFVYTTESKPFWYFARSKSSLSVLEIAKLATPNEVFAFKNKVDHILQTWFNSRSMQGYRDAAVKAIVEICNNSIEHSVFTNGYDQYGECYCMLQKYAHTTTNTEISIAIGDLGVGIRAHLQSKYHWPQNDVFYIKKALSGLSGRREGAGGLGLQRAQEITRQFGGSLIVRSGKGIVLIQNQAVTENELNHPLQGTQCLISLSPKISY